MRENPELAIFLTLALGFVIGRLRFGTFRLGNVVGRLLAGVLVGQLDIKVAPIVKVVFFDLFRAAMRARIAGPATEGAPTSDFRDHVRPGVEF